MPRYDFTDGQVTEEHVVSIADLAEYTEWLEKAGWRRVYTPASAIIVYPGMAEALAESTAIADRGGPGRGIG